MRLRTVAKLSVVVSVLLFGVAVAFYAFTQLDLAKRNREVNFYSMIPDNCMAVLESDHLDSFLNGFPSLNYSQEIDNFEFPVLFEFFLHELNEYATQNAHGLSSQMSRLMVSFHQPGTVRDQVIYFQMGASDEQMLEEVLQEYTSSDFLAKEETYRGKKITIYPVGHDEFLAVYVKDGCVALSYQKRLIEQVVDAQLDQTSLGEDAVFAQILEKKKSDPSLTLYTRSASLPLLDEETPCWSEYDFHLNSDVLYLTGEMYREENWEDLDENHPVWNEVFGRNEEDFFLSADKDSTLVAMEQVYETGEGKNRTLFHECVANLSREALFTMVTDMEKVIQQPEQFTDYLPSFVLKNARLFRPFILSVQLSMINERPSHIWVFTYKN